MNPEEFCRIAGRLMQHPTAPYHEHAVRAEAEGILREAGLRVTRDQFGNVLAKVATAPRNRPVVFAAHMDHPGFEVVQQNAKKLVLRFRGSVPQAYFREGAPLRGYPGPVRVMLGRSAGEEKTYEAIVVEPGSAPQLRFATWDLDSFSIRGTRIHGLGCDDVVGVACVIAALLELKRCGAAVHAIGVLSRAEEVGFHGALALASERKLPRKSLVISLETSKELPGVAMGNGVIIRVGDKAAVFDSSATRFLSEVATELHDKDGAFQFQRALMGGGTCEATAYQEFGYQAAAMCIALGNYHNCGSDNIIAAEYVDLNDACGMVDLLAEAAARIPDYADLTSRLNKRLWTLLEEARANLPGSAED